MIIIEFVGGVGFSLSFETANTVTSFSNLSASFNTSPFESLIRHSLISLFSFVVIATSAVLLMSFHVRLRLFFDLDCV